MTIQTSIHLPLCVLAFNDSILAKLLKVDQRTSLQLLYKATTSGG